MRWAASRLTFFLRLIPCRLYEVAGRPVFLPRLIVGLALTALLTYLNYRGVRLSATFQNWTSFGTLALFVIFVLLGVSRGSAQNFAPLFTHTPLISILLVIQIVPYFMTGFESVGKAAEEANPRIPRPDLSNRDLDGDPDWHSVLRQHRVRRLRSWLHGVV